METFYESGMVLNNNTIKARQLWIHFVIVEWVHLTTSAKTTNESVLEPNKTITSFLVFNFYQVNNFEKRPSLKVVGKICVHIILILI